MVIRCSISDFTKSATANEHRKTLVASFAYAVQLFATYSNIPEIPTQPFVKFGPEIEGVECMEFSSKCEFLIA